MIRLLEKNDVNILTKKYNLNAEYLDSLIDNMTEYMYISLNKEIDGFMICIDNGEYINIKSIIGNPKDFLKHLIFNANKDITIENEIEDLNNYDFYYDGSKYIRKYKSFRPNNIKIFDYYEQTEEFKKELLNQINEPL